MSKRSLVRLTSCAVLVALASCGSDTAPQSSTTLYFVAVFANPNVTVRVNGRVLGQLKTQFTGSLNGTNSCPPLAQAAATGTALSLTVRSGEQWEFAWDYGNGQSDADNLNVTSDVVESTCLVEPIPAPPGVPARFGGR